MFDAQLVVNNNDYLVGMELKLGKKIMCNNFLELTVFAYNYLQKLSCFLCESLFSPYMMGPHVHLQW